MLDRDFFNQYQKQLVWFANTRFGKWFLKINTDKKIVRISPNHFDVIEDFQDDKVILTAEFKTRNVYAEAIDNLFNWLPFNAHQPIFLNNRWYLQPKFGLTTTDFKPTSGSSSPVDSMLRSHGYNYATARDGSFELYAGSDSEATLYTIFNNSGYNVYRCYFLFDTSSLTSGASISAATLSLYITYKQQESSSGWADLYIVASSPSSNSTIGTSDWGNIGSTGFGSIAYSSVSIGGYNAITLDSNGIANISKTGVSKFGSRIKQDLNNLGQDPGYGNNQYTLYSADQGSSYAPKLTITYVASQNFTKTLTETLTASETRINASGKKISESILFTELRNNKTAKILSESITLSEILSKIRGKYKNLTETITLTDLLSKSKGAIRTFLNSISVTEVLSKKYGGVKSLTESLSLTETRINGVVKYFTESISFTDSFNYLRSCFLTVIDSIKLFDSNFIIDSYNENNYDSWNVLAMQGQSFTANTNIVLSSASFYLKKFSSPTGYATAKLYNLTSNYGIYKPIGSPIAVSENFDVSTLTTTNQLISFNFTGTNQVMLSSGVHYGIALEYSGSGGSVHLGRRGISPTHGGNAFYFSDLSHQWEGVSSYDNIFYVYGFIGVLKSISKTLSDTITETDTFIRAISIGRIFTETISLSETLIKSIVKSLYDTMDIAEIYLKSIAKSLVDDIILSDTLSKFVGHIKEFIDSTGLTDSLERLSSFYRTFADNITIAETLKRYLNGILIIWEKVARTTSTAWNDIARTISTTFTKRTKPTSNWTKRIKP